MNIKIVYTLFRLL